MRGELKGQQLSIPSPIITGFRVLVKQFVLLFLIPFVNFTKKIVSLFVELFTILQVVFNSDAAVTQFVIFFRKLLQVIEFDLFFLVGLFHTQISCKTSILTLQSYVNMTFCEFLFTLFCNLFSSSFCNIFCCLLYTSDAADE